MKKEKLIDYLYDEMAEGEPRSIEKDDEKVIKELNALRSLRTFLQSDRDEELGLAPIFVKPKRRILVSKWWTLAASLALLLLTGRLMNLRVDVGDNQINVYYGEKAPADPHRVKYDEVLASLGDLREDIRQQNDQFRTTSFASTEQSNILTEQEILAVLKKAQQKENDSFGEELTQRLQQDQQEYTREVVKTLVDFWDGQRRQDLQLINDGLQNLAQAINLDSDGFAQFVNQTVQNY